MQHVFIVGSKGIPAAYGGFETFVENLTAKKQNTDICYHVSRLSDADGEYEYNGAKCFDVKVPDIGSAKAIFYDVKALKRCIGICKKLQQNEKQQERGANSRPVFYVLACRIGPFIKSLARQIHAMGGVLYVNPDGHEWKRSKWSAPVRRYWKFSEKLMVKHADLLVCDSKNIESYIKKEYGRYHPKTTFIAYGSETKASALTDENEQYLNWLREKQLKPQEYYLIVGRFVPENNFKTMIREFMKSSTTKDLAIITTPNEKLSAALEEELHFKEDKRIKFVGTVYDGELLKKIRENAYGYFHGHEVGGTNPSLLEALGSTRLNLLLKVGFNEEVAEESALYWSKDDESLATLIGQADAMSDENIAIMGQKAKQRVEEHYSWNAIVSAYENIFLG